MQNLKKLFSELGISKVRLAKYLGVSRQMLYNYLAEEKLENWPKEKVMKILCLLGIKDVKDLDTIKVVSVPQIPIKHSPLNTPNCFFILNSFLFYVCNLSQSFLNQTL
jgi:predicted transcriptional regulator